MSDARWRPIDTAPKDQTEILVVHRGIDANYMSVVWWDDTFDGWLVAALADESIYVEPTHWMPLPEPPAAAAVDPHAGNTGPTSPRVRKSFSPSSSRKDH